ncbi:MAG: tRNA (adenine-N1)-methyltransferase [Candidatus Methanofastidiosa archaeon]|nr:tRNA (adenine-N1)-methyltransferase [Candidatus Methanofastidiosa archaeon]
MAFKEGERLLLIDEKGKKFMITLGERSQLHTHGGVIELADIVGKEPGYKAITHKGLEFVVIYPNLMDYIEKMRKLPQTIQAKDSSQIIANTGLCHGMNVVEAGVGSGALTLLLCSIVEPGTVTSYEIREDFANLARKNIREYGCTNSVIKLQDIYEGIDEKDVDLVALDLPEPEKVTEHALGALRPGGHLFSFSPTIEQVIRLHDSLRYSDWMEVKTIECIVREYEKKRMGTRPKTLMVGHTGYMTFARKR